MPQFGSPSAARWAAAGRRLAAVLLAVLLWSAAGAAAVSAHGGYPTRLGVREDPDLALLTQVVLVYLVDGQGMNVHLTRFDSGADLGREYASGKMDLLIEVAGGDGFGTECAPGSEEAYFADSFPGSWAGLFDFTVGTSPCSHPALVAHAKVASDLRFTLLRGTLEKLLDNLTAADLEWMRREGRGGPREAAAAARRLLKGKGLL